MIQTTDPGSTFQLPSDIIDSQLGKGLSPQMTQVAAGVGASSPAAAPPNAPSLLFTASGGRGAAATQELADLPAMMMGRGGAAGADGAGGVVPGEQPE